jgi:hypothetical protein
MGAVIGRFTLGIRLADLVSGGAFAAEERLTTGASLC